MVKGKMRLNDDDLECEMYSALQLINEGLHEFKGNRADSIKTLRLAKGIIRLIRIVKFVWTWWVV